MPQSLREAALGADPATDVEVLQRALDGAVFPLQPRQLALLARENEAAPVLLTRLSTLEARAFASLDEVATALTAER